MTTPSIKCSGIVFDAVAAGTLPNNALYLDTQTQSLTNKGGTGVSAPIGASATSTASAFVKTMHNLTGFTITAGTPVSKEADGSIAPAGAGTAGAMRMIGYVISDILNNAQGSVSLLGGPNWPGVLSGAYLPGDAVYLAHGGGYTSDTSTLGLSTDTLVRIGFADCAQGVASTTVSDLLIFPEVISTYG